MLVHFTGTDRVTLPRKTEVFVHTRVNVAERERWASSLIGAGLATYGLRRRRSIAGALMVSAGGALLMRGATGHCPMYQAAGIDTADHHAVASRISVDETVTINATPARLYAFWRDFANLPRLSDALQSVEQIDGKRSRWKAKGPAGTTVEWDAEVTNEIPDELIEWRTLDRADVISAGSVRFKALPAGRGTEVHVRMRYEPPMGTVGKTAAWLLGKEPSQTIREELRHFKMLMESGEIATTEGQPRGRQSLLNYD